MTDQEKSSHSDAEIDEAVKKLSSDSRYLIESSFSIVDKDSRLKPLLFTPAQDHYWSRITPRDIIVKSRKLGFSTIRLARMVAQ